MKLFVRVIHFFMGRFYYDGCYLYYWNYCGSKFKDKGLHVCVGFEPGSSFQHKWFKCKDCPYNKRYIKRKENDQNVVKDF